MKYSLERRVIGSKIRSLVLLDCLDSEKDSMNENGAFTPNLQEAGSLRYKNHMPKFKLKLRFSYVTH